MRFTLSRCSKSDLTDRIELGVGNGCHGNARGGLLESVTLACGLQTLRFSSLNGARKGSPQPRNWNPRKALVLHETAV